MDLMRWSEEHRGGTATPAGTTNELPIHAAPTIKNHSATEFRNLLICFGGYDGRRNHMTLLVYSLLEKRWIRPVHTTNSPHHHHLHHLVHNHHHNPAAVVGGGFVDRPLDAASSSSSVSPNMPPAINASPASNNNGNNNNSISPSSSTSGTTGGGGGGSLLHPIWVTGNPPPGRNGHSATLVLDPDDEEENGRIFIIGGWLGTGPLAASDLHVLEITHGGRHLRWYQPAVQGRNPGSCNMHTADYVPNQKAIYVFRGGNGREYLNDLHALDVNTMTWRRVETTGAIPQQRANHSSAILEETAELFIFGGWNGTERLNDIHILDTETSNWTCPHVGGVLPHPRAGMTLTALRGRLYLFGGSGTSAKCFQDLQILDRQEMAWLDVTPYEAGGNGCSSAAGGLHCSTPADDADMANRFAFGPSAAAVSSPSSSWNRYDEGGCGPSSPRNSAEGRYMGDYLMDEPEQQRSPQQGGDFTTTSSPRTFSGSRSSDWRSRDMGSTMRRQYQSPNPNDEDTVPTVLIQGRGPGRRAGHTATAVNRKIYIFGGSCGSDYLNDFWVLDTDPPPHAAVREPNSLQLVERRLRHFFNDEEFSDVTFVVQGQKVYGHKMVLSIVSDCFRAMFTTGFRESEAMEIEIPDCSHVAFLAVMEYIYTGCLPKPLMDMSVSGGNPLDTNHLGRVVELLELADRFFLDHLKQICETLLQPAVSAETVEYLSGVSQKTNSSQLQSICEHFIRNRQSI